MLLIVSPQFPACCENEIIDVCKALRIGSDERHEQITPPALSFLPHSCLHVPCFGVGPLHSAHLAGPRLGTKVLGSRECWQVSSCLACAQIPPWHSWLLLSKKPERFRCAPWGWNPHRQCLFKAIASPHGVDSIRIFIKLILWLNMGGPAQKLHREAVLWQSFLSLLWSYGRALGFSVGSLFLSLLLRNSWANSAEICILKWKKREEFTFYGDVL